MEWLPPRYRSQWQAKNQGTFTGLFRPRCQRGLVTAPVKQDGVLDHWTGYASRQA